MDEEEVDQLLIISEETANIKVFFDFCAEQWVKVEQPEIIILCEIHTLMKKLTNNWSLNSNFQ